MGAGASTQLDSQLDQLVKEGLEQGAKEEDVLQELSKRAQDRLAKLPEKEQKVTDSLMAGGKETVILELGTQDFKRRGSPKPLEEVEQIILLLDPRGDAFKFYCADDPKDPKANVRHEKLLTPEILNKTIVFYLLPSLTSSPEALMGVEWITGGMCETLLPVCDEAMDLCVLRIDEYMIHGDSLLVQMVDDGKLVCPAEEAEGMLGMFSPVDSRIPGDKHTMWSHIIVSWGHEYGAYCEFREVVGGSRLESVLKNLGSRGLSGKALPPPEKEKAPPPRVIFQKSARPLFVAFSPSASTRYSKQLGTRVPCFGRKERVQLHKWLQARTEAEPEIRKAREERDEKEENGEDVSKIPVPELPKPPPELEQFLSDSVYPVMILEAEDMPFEYTKDYGRCSIAMDYAQAVSDAGQGPGRSCAIAVGQNFDSFAKNASSVETLMKLTENYMPTLFATDEELTKAASLFTNPQHPQEFMPDVLAQLLPGFNYCGPLFFSLPSALGQELEDDSNLSPALTVGTGSSGIPKEKFNGKFMAEDSEGGLLTERALRAAEGVESVSVIHPSGLLMKMFSSLLEQQPDADWAATLEDWVNTLKDYLKPEVVEEEAQDEEEGY